MMEKERKQRAKEEYVIVLDYLKHGYSNDSRPFHMKEPILQVIGKDHFVLLELIPKPKISFKANDEVYIGDGERDQIEYIKGSLKVEKLVDENCEKYINFFNNSGPISLRSHQLEILPGIGKKHARELLAEREVEPFKDFEDIKKRISSVPNPKKAIIERILSELEDKDRFKLFVRV